MDALFLWEVVINMNNKLNDSAFINATYDIAEAYAKSCRKPKISTYAVLAELDTSIGGYFDSTIQIRDYGDDLACYLGNTDISNELPYGMMETIIEDSQ